MRSLESNSYTKYYKYFSALFHFYVMAGPWAPYKLVLGMKNQKHLEEQSVFAKHGGRWKD